jgi:hypothetical protein
MNSAFEEIVMHLINDSVDESIITRLKVSGHFGWDLAKGWEEAYYEDEECWYLVSDPEDLRTDRPTVRLMAAEELIMDKNFKFIDRALEALFEMVLDEYDEHR